MNDATFDEDYGLVWQLWRWNYTAEYGNVGRAKEGHMSSVFRLFGPLNQ